jgi:hypothetical protein
LKALLFAGTLCLSLSAFAAPQTAHLEGSMTFDGDLKTVPVQLDLTLKKEKSAKLDYKGVLTYMQKGKTRTQSMRIELDIKDQETTGYGNFDFYRLGIQGALLDLAVGTDSVLHLTLVRDGGMECIPAPPPDRQVCYPGPDVVVDEGTMDLTVISAQ